MKIVLRKRMMLLTGLLSMALAASAQIRPDSGVIPDVPEPSTWIIGLTGLGGLAALKFLRRKSNRS